jgi:hypothetical protein
LEEVGAKDEGEEDHEVELQVLLGVAGTDLAMQTWKAIGSDTMKAGLTRKKDEIDLLRL